MDIKSIALSSELLDPYKGQVRLNLYTRETHPVVRPEPQKAETQAVDPPAQAGLPYGLSFPGPSSK